MPAIAVHNILIETKLRFDKILSLEITAPKDDHTRMEATVLISNDIRQQIVEAYRDEKVKVWITDENGEKDRPIFAGLVQGLHMDYEGEMETVTISAASATILLDTEKKTARFKTSRSVIMTS